MSSLETGDEAEWERSWLNSVQVRTTVAVLLLPDREQYGKECITEGFTAAGSFNVKKNDFNENLWKKEVFS